LGKEHNSNFERHVRQIGEIIYNLPLDDEELKHLKKQPNSVITEQGLMEILGPNLESLDLKNKIWVSNDLICRLGYLAINLEV
jgi:F-box/leucine-rich repeat protein 2/20